MPLVSICIPAYNCAGFIAETMDCLFNQTYKAVEIILVNDGSTDETLTLLKEKIRAGVFLIDQPNLGASAARNAAYQQASGEFIIFFDADDYIGPDFIELQMRKIRELDNAVVLSAWGRFYRSDHETFALNKCPVEEMTFPEWIGYYWLNGNPMTNPGRAIIPRALLEAGGLWNEQLSLNDDFEFFTRIFLQAKKIIFNQDALFYYRSGVSGLSGTRGVAADHSYYRSVELAVDQVLAVYGTKPALREACANIWQLFVYSIYPHSSDLTQKAELKIKSLGGASLPFPSGRVTRLLSHLIGWKAAAKIRSFFNR